MSRPHEQKVDSGVVYASDSEASGSKGATAASQPSQQQVSHEKRLTLQLCIAHDSKQDPLGQPQSRLGSVRLSRLTFPSSMETCI